MAEMDKSVRDVRLGWAEDHPSVKTWLNKLSEGSARVYLDILYRYFEWLEENGKELAGKTPEEVIELQKRAEDKYRQLDILQRWIVSLSRLRVNTQKTMYTGVQSFYAYNRTPLPKDKRFRLRSETQPVEGKLDVEGLRKIITSSNTAYQAVYLIMFQAGMGVAEFQHFNLNGWEEVKPQLEGDKPVRVSLPGRKHGGSYESKPFYSFFGRDAKRALLKYLNEERGSVKKGEAIFLNEKGGPVTKSDLRAYFHRHARQVGVIQQVTPDCPECGGVTRRDVRKVNRVKTRVSTVFYLCNECGKEYRANDPRLRKFVKRSRSTRYGVNPHELRDVFRTEWEVSPAKGIVAEFLMGHDIDVNNYNKFFRDHEFTMREYRKAEHHLNIMSEDPRVVSIYDMMEVRKELTAVKEENKRLKERLNGLLSMPVHKNIRTQGQRIQELEKEKANLENRIQKTEEKLVELTKMVEKLIENQGE